MANRWSHPHGKTSSEVVPFTWQPTCSGQAKAQRSRHHNCQRPDESLRHGGQNRDREGDNSTGTGGPSCVAGARYDSVIAASVAASTPVEKPNAVDSASVN
jgi:hypothetical protein